MIPDAILTCSQKRSSLKHAETADAWTPVIDAGTAVRTSPTRTLLVVLTA